MKETKTIEVKLNRIYDAYFSLKFEEDEQGNEIGILTCPYIKWLSRYEHVILENVYKLSGKELECIEKLYFDNKAITMPIENYHKRIDMEDVIHRIIPDEIYNNLINGTYKIAAHADKII